MKEMFLKKTSCETSFQAYKISKIQALLGLRPLDPHQGFTLDTPRASGRPPDPLPQIMLRPHQLQFLDPPLICVVRFSFENKKLEILIL
jgi:hypothetical protein